MVVLVEDGVCIYFWQCGVEVFYSNVYFLLKNILLAFFSHVIAGKKVVGGANMKGVRWSRYPMPNGI